MKLHLAADERGLTAAWHVYEGSKLQSEAYMGRMLCSAYHRDTA